MFYVSQITEELRLNDGFTKMQTQDLVFKLKHFFECVVTVFFLYLYSN